MNLLILNLKNDLNDSALAHCPILVDSLAKNFKNVDVISGYVGRVTRARNITYYNLNIKSSLFKTIKIFTILRFYFFLFKILLKRGKKLVVFAHMAPLYALLAAPILRVFNIPISLWYAHREVTVTLKVASNLVNKIITPNPRSFRAQTQTPIYYLLPGVYFSNKFFRNYTKIENNICIHGRISEVKNIHVLIKSIFLLRTNFGMSVVLNIYGDCLTDRDFLYKKRLTDFIRLNNLDELIKFHGPCNLLKLHEQFKKNLIGLNLGIDWSLDKAGIEVLGNGLPLIYTNSDYNMIFEKHNIDFSNYFLKNLNSFNLAEKIFLVISNKDLQTLPFSFINDIRNTYNIDSFVCRLFPLITDNQK